MENGAKATYVEAVLVRRVMIGDGSCKWDGLDGILATGFGGVVMPVDGLSSAVIWMLLDMMVTLLLLLILARVKRVISGDIPFIYVPPNAVEL